MKQIYILLVAMCAMCFTGCSKDDDDNDNDNDNDDDNREGVITMVKKEGNKVYSFGFCSFKEGEMITIDWGDGQVEEVITSETYDEGKVYYFWEGKHPYSDNKPHTITIKGNIKGLYCNGHGSNENYLTTLDVSRCKTLIELYCCQTNLTTLDVSRNTALTYLNCNSNAITTLDVSKNTTLTYLDCSNNNLSASALNQIFNDLPQVSDRDIFIYNNPGSQTCNKSIAENKGWRVITHR